MTLLDSCSLWIEQGFYRAIIGSAETFSHCSWSVYFLFFHLTGLFAAAHDLEIDWVIVKGISHFYGDSNTPDESWESFASIMAASVVSNILLNEPGVFKNRPHYEGMSHLCFD